MTTVASSRHDTRRTHAAQATHPATMTHVDVPREERMARGLTDSVVRLSVGIEDPQDIIADLSQALELAAKV